MSIPFDLRGAGADHTIRAAALQHADEVVRSHSSLSDSTATQMPTVGALLNIACAPDTTRKRETHSEQHGEWDRARREVLALLPETFPLASLSGGHIASIAKSATLRRACAADVAQWTTALAGHVDPLQLSDPGQLDRAMILAYKDLLLSQGRDPVPIKETWSRRVVELLRAMVRHVASRHMQFSAWAKFITPPDFMNDVRAMRRELGLRMDSTPFRPRRDAEDARALMRELDDPRYWMRDCLATMVGAPSVGDVRASQIRVLDDGSVEIFAKRREKCAHRAIWHPCEASVAEVLRTLLANPYVELERERAAGGPDYRLVSDVRWDGEHLRRIRTADDAPDPANDWLLEQRAWLLLMLGAEGRMGQVRRAMRSNLHIEGTLHTFVLDVPDTERKRASWLLLAPVQRRAVVFMQTVGYLAELERAFEAGTIADYPLFPQGRLVAGRARVEQTEICDDKQLNDWARDVEARLGLERVKGEGLYGWRRCFVDLFAHWSTNPRVKDLVTGHTDMRDPNHSNSTRVTVYLDPRDLPYLLEVQHLLQHVRTLFVRTGGPPGPRPPHAGD